MKMRLTATPGCCRQQGDSARFLVKVADMELSITTQDALQASSQGKQRFIVPETVNWFALMHSFAC